MFLYLHAPVALALTAQLTNPAATFTIGLASHFLIDMIPHGDRQLDAMMERKSRKVKLAFMTSFAMIDTIAVACIVWYMDHINMLSISSCAAVIGAMLPDYIWGVHEVTKWKILDRYRSFHSWFQSFRGRDVPLWFGVCYQTLAAVWLLKYIS